MGISKEEDGRRGQAWWMVEKISHGILSHVRNGRANVWRIQEEDEEEREEKGNTSRW